MLRIPDEIDSFLAMVCYCAYTALLGKKFLQKSLVDQVIFHDLVPNRRKQFASKSTVCSLPTHAGLAKTRLLPEYLSRRRRSLLIAAL
jgi:hypothetical protein